jgi:hypothetical protein
MRPFRDIVPLLALALLVLELTGCASSPAAPLTPSPTAVSTPQPTATPAAPSPTVTIPAPLPTVTAAPSPTATSTPRPPIASLTAVAVPTAAAVPPQTTGPTPTGSRTVTLADDGQTVTLRVGERFLLNLGDTFIWQVTPADPTVLSRMVNVLTIKGSQGLYEAHKAGRTELMATGDPPCRQSQPPCGAPSRVFRIQVVVEP